MVWLPLLAGLLQPSRRSPRVPRIHASVIEAAPPKALPVGAAPADLEALLLRVLTAEQQQRVSSTPPSLAVLCDELEGDHAENARERR